MNSEKGQATVELAFSLVILLLILFGIADFGRILHAHLTIEHASREAARFAAVGNSDSEITTKINNTASSLDTSKIGVSISPSGEASRTRGSEVKIILTYPVDFLTPIISNVIKPFTLSNETVMRVE